MFLQTSEKNIIQFNQALPFHAALIVDRGTLDEGPVLYQGVFGKFFKEGRRHIASRLNCSRYSFTFCLPRSDRSVS